MNVKPTPDGLANLILPALVDAFNSRAMTTPVATEALRRTAVIVASEIRAELAKEILGFAEAREKEASQEDGPWEAQALNGEARALRHLSAVLRGDKTSWR